MKAPKIMLLVLAVAGIAILLSGCATTDYRTKWARIRCERVMAQARLNAAWELLAEGYVDKANEVFQQVLPDAAAQTTPLRMLAADDEDDTEDNSSQYAKVTLESDLDPESQTW